MSNFLSAVVPAMLGFLAFWIAFYPPARSKRKWFLIAIVLLTVASAILSYNGASVLDTVVKNTSEPAYFSMLEPVQASALAAGQKCVFNINYKNGGSVSTIGMGKIRAQCFLRPLATTEAEQKALSQDFEDYWNTTPEKFDLTETAPNGSGEISTNLGPTYSADDVQAITAGKKTIYLLTRIVYTDKYNTHTQDFCLLAQPPQTTINGSFIQFHVCPFGNTHS